MLWAIFSFNFNINMFEMCVKSETYWMWFHKVRKQNRKKKLQCFSSKKSCLNLYIDKKRHRNIAAAVQSLVYTNLSQMSLLHHRIFHELIIIIVMYLMHRRFSQSSALGKRKPQKSISIAVHVHFSKMIRILYTTHTAHIVTNGFLFFSIF